MEYTALLFAVTIAFVACSIMMYNKPKEEEHDTSRLIFVFVVVFSMSYLVIKLIVDNNDDKQVMNNIKSGDPPF